MDEIAANRAVLTGEATGTPKIHGGPVEALGALKSVHRSANNNGSHTGHHQIRAALVIAPDELRARLRDLPRGELLATCGAFRIAADDDSLAGVTRLTLRKLAHRVAFLDTAQIKSTVVRLKRITEQLPASPPRDGRRRAPTPSARCCSPRATTPTGSATSGRSPASPAATPCPPPVD